MPHETSHPPIVPNTGPRGARLRGDFISEPAIRNPDDGRTWAFGQPFASGDGFASEWKTAFETFRGFTQGVIWVSMDDPSEGRKRHSHSIRKIESALGIRPTSGNCASAHALSDTLGTRPLRCLRGAFKRRRVLALIAGVDDPSAFRHEAGRILRRILRRSLAEGVRVIVWTGTLPPSLAKRRLKRFLRLDATAQKHGRFGRIPWPIDESPSKRNSSEAHAGEVRTQSVERAPRWPSPSLRDRLKLWREQSLGTLVSALEVKDPFTRHHSENVAMLCEAFATRLKLPRRLSRDLVRAARVHDIGKIGIPDAILNKPGKLTPEERCAIERHSEMGVMILRGHEGFHDLLPVVRHHHERFDGRGYPDGLTGKAIPHSARILCLLDAVEAMHAPRAYKPARMLEDILVEARSQRGAQFDPDLVDALLEWLPHEGREMLEGMVGAP